MGSQDAGPGMRNAIRREYRCVFTTRGGLVDATFQKEAGLTVGDEIVLFDGFGVAIVLSHEEGVTQRMKGAVAVMGLREVNVERPVRDGSVQAARFQDRLSNMLI
jgi:predicted GNAT superfamily acetyltransferase